MSPRFARFIAWALFGIYIILATVGLTLQVLTQTYLRDLGFPTLLVITFVAGLLFFIGAVIVWRYPHHPIGWLCCLLPSVWGIDLISFGYAYYGLIAHPGSLPGAAVMLIWQSWTGGSFVIILITLMILWFPDGRPLSPQWGRIAWLAVGAIAIYLPLDAVEPGPLEVFPFLLNPIGVSETLWAVLDPLRSITNFIGIVLMLAATLSLGLRLHQARGDERQQIKWIAYAGSYFTLSLALVNYGGISSSETILRIGIVLHSISLVGVLIALIFAIFKFRLYDIDLIINRTLVYSALTGSLALIYIMSVVLFQQIFPSESPISIVLSTLAIAALFTPLRRRMQKMIDKRFYRRKYDAQQTMAAFGLQMRDQVGLEELSQALLAVVRETIQPERVSLWLRPSREGARGVDT